VSGPSAAPCTRGIVSGWERSSKRDPYARLAVHRCLHSREWVPETRLTPLQSQLHYPTWATLESGGVTSGTDLNVREHADHLAESRVPKCAPHDALGELRVDAWRLWYHTLGRRMLTRVRRPSDLGKSEPTPPSPTARDHGGVARAVVSVKRIQDRHGRSGPPWKANPRTRRVSTTV